MNAARDARDESETCVVVGAGGHGRVVVEHWRAARPHARFVFVDDSPELHGTHVLGAEVVGPLATLGELVGAARGGAEVVLALGNNRVRLALAERLEREVPGIAWGTVVHPSAVVMPSATIGAGTVVFARAVVGSSARIAEHVIVNTGVIVEHDALVERGASLSPGTCSGGRIVVREGAFVATGVTLAPRVEIGAWSVIGAGAVVVRDVPDRSLAHGVPARVVSAVDDAFDWKRLL